LAKITAVFADAFATKKGFAGSGTDSMSIMGADSH